MKSPSLLRSERTAAVEEAQTLSDEISNPSRGVTCEIRVYEVEDRLVITGTLSTPDGESSWTHEVPNHLQVQSRENMHLQSVRTIAEIMRRALGVRS